MLILEMTEALVLRILSGACRTVSHASLLHALIQASLPSRALVWITDCLDEGQLFVRTRQGDAEHITANHNMPQGSVLSQIPFNVVVAGLRSCI